jgi:ABC-type transport system involved in multi-copper enzyme maturation permease subunit
MLGPVFNAEMLRAGRRGKAHYLRWIYVAWLCLQIAYVFDHTHSTKTYVVGNWMNTSRLQSDIDFGHQFRDMILWQEFALILLVTPAFVAGAITDEKTRGTLAGLLTAYVTPADVVLGKLAARLCQVGLLALTPLPFLTLVGPYAGLTPEFLICWVAVTLLFLAGVGGVSMLASVWARQTRTAVVAAYVALLGGNWLSRWLAGTGSPSTAWLDWFDPLRPLALALDRADPAVAFHRLGQAAIVWGGLAIATTTLAVWRLRPAYIRQLEARPRRLIVSSMMARPKPVRDIIAWKEFYVGRRIPTWLGVPIAFLVSAVVTTLSIGGRGRPWAIASQLTELGISALLVLTLVVGVRCSGSITGERERQTWDGLMTSPLTPRELVRGKLRGVLRGTWPYLIAVWLAAAVIAAFSATGDQSGPSLIAIVGLAACGLLFGWAPRAVGWVAIGWAVCMAATAGGEVAFTVVLAIPITWLTMYFLGAAGLYCSARSNSSWRSLVGTVALGYAGGSALFCLGMPIGCIGSTIVSILFAVIQTAFGQSINDPFMGVFPYLVYPAAIAVGPALLLWMVARSFLATAEMTVAKRDRMPPDWVRMIEYDLPRHGRRRPVYRVPR